MDLDLTKDELEFREEVRDFLRTEYLKGNAPELQRMVNELER